MRKRFIAPAPLSVALFGGCSGFDDERGRGDAPIGPYDDSPAEVVNFPDKFANVAHKCDGHGHRIYYHPSGGGDGDRRRNLPGSAGPVVPGTTR